MIVLNIISKSPCVHYWWSWTSSMCSIDMQLAMRPVGSLRLRAHRLKFLLSDYSYLEFWPHKSNSLYSLRSKIKLCEIVDHKLAQNLTTPAPPTFSKYCREPTRHVVRNAVVCRLAGVRSWKYFCVDEFKGTTFAAILLCIWREPFFFNFKFA